jgi:hypothetical protein
MEGIARPIRVTAHASWGLASALDGFPPNVEGLCYRKRRMSEPCTSTAGASHIAPSRAGASALPILSAACSCVGPHSAAHATYTASWAAPKSDVHTEQRFFYLGR